MALSKKQEKALDLVEKFRTSSDEGKWSHIEKDDVVKGLKERIVNPTVIRQAGNPTCGPTSFVYTLAKGNPEAYATMVIDLFTKGKAKVKKLSIEASSSLRKAKMIGDDPDPVDWIAFTSLRNSHNYMWPIWLKVVNNLAGMTDPAKIVTWMKKAGYKDVQSKSYLALSPTPIAKATWLLQASKLFQKGHQVLLLIDGDLMDENTQDDAISMYPTHWIVLRSKVKDGGVAAYESKISCKVWTWGSPYNIPVNKKKPLKKKHFLNKFYGFVSGRL
jgi:hypothetical protein